MKNSKISKLVAILLVGIIVLTGCSKGDSKVSNAGAQSDAYVIGISQLAEHPALDDARRGFEDGLVELGVKAEIVYQNAQGDIPNSLSIAQKFVKDKVDLIYAIATPAAQSAKQAAKDIPVLFSAVTDPVKSEIVADWNNVGGNVTGTSDMAPTQLQLKMFKEIDENINKIGILYNTGESNSEIQIDEVKSLAPHENLEVVAVGITNISEMSQALDSLLNKVDAVYVISDNLVASSMELFSKTLLDYKKISISSYEIEATDGILVTNGLSYYELGKQTAKMAKEILVDKNKPAAIPVGISEKTVTTVNEKTLKALGIDVNLPIFKDAIKVGN